MVRKKRTDGSSEGGEGSGSREAGPHSGGGRGGYQQGGGRGGGQQQGGRGYGPQSQQGGRGGGGRGYGQPPQQYGGPRGGQPPQQYGGPREGQPPQHQHQHQQQYGGGPRGGPPRGGYGGGGRVGPPSAGQPQRQSVPELHQATSPTYQAVSSQPTPSEVSPTRIPDPSPPVQEFEQLSIEQGATSQAIQPIPSSSKAFKFPMRPGKGQVGKRCIVKANHFFAELPDKDLHQYDVSFGSPVPLLFFFLKQQCI